MCLNHSNIRKQTEIFVSRNPRCAKIIANDENRHFIVSWNDHRTRNSRFHIRAMRSYLPCKHKSRGKKNLFQSLPGYRRDSRHGSDRQHILLLCDNLRSHPLIPLQGVTAFFKHIVQRPLLASSCDEKLHRLLQRPSSRLRRITGAGNIQRQSMCDELLPLPPNARCGFDVHPIHYIISSRRRQREGWNRAGNRNHRSRLLPFNPATYLILPP